MGVSANLESTEPSGETVDNEEESSESSEEESVSSEPETEMTDVVPQFETLFCSLLAIGVSMGGFS